MSGCKHTISGHRADWGLDMRLRRRTGTDNDGKVGGVARLLVLMGSGETAPTMRTTHRRVFAAVGDGRAVGLDTPYGFQGNADDLSARTEAYFVETVGRTMETVSFRRATDAVGEAVAVGALRAAVLAYAGPGSPTYAAAQWRSSALPSVLVERLLDDAGSFALVLSSAAALTAGASVLPVYEIYKAGEDIHWDEGLGVLGRVLGAGFADAVVVPHWDNAEGGSHDTRFCYLGAPRLLPMEALLPAGAPIIGIDEHTALVIDLDAGTATVEGKGGVTLRRAGDGTPAGAGAVLVSGATVAIDALVGTANQGAAAVRGDAAVLAPSTERRGSPLVDAARAEEAAFNVALDAADGPSAVAAALCLEDELEAWAKDTAQTDDRDRARVVLRSLIARLGTAAATGLADPRTAIAPLVDVVLVLRSSARTDKRWADADLIRDALGAAGVEVRDTPDGVEWDLTAA